MVALRCATPVGELATLAVPATAAGPSLKRLVIGSEGTLGAITSVGLRVFPLPAAQRYEGWFVHSFAEGADALRQLVQAGLEPDVARLSDEAETRMGQAIGGAAGSRASAGRALLRARGYAERLPGDLRLGGRRRGDRAPPRPRGARAESGRARCRSGEGPGRSWLAGRYAGPHLRDDLLDRGVLVETLETATSWSNLEALKAAVTRALERTLAAPLVMCHVSHLYATGASLYFTALAAQDASDPFAQWQRAKAAATDAIVATGGTISHHHAVGADHAPWMPAELGAAGARRAARAQGALRPGRGDEPREAAGRLGALGSAPTSTTGPGFFALPSVSRVTTTRLKVASQRGNLSRSSVRGPVVPSRPLAPTGCAKPSRCAAAPGLVNQTA